MAYDDLVIKHKLIQDSSDFDMFIEEQLTNKPFRNSRREIKEIKPPTSYPAVVGFSWFEDDEKNDHIEYDYVLLSEFEGMRTPEKPVTKTFTFIKSKLNDFICARVEKFESLPDEKQINTWTAKIISELQTYLVPQLFISCMPDDVKMNKTLIP